MRGDPAAGVKTAGLYHEKMIHGGSGLSDRRGIYLNRTFFRGSIILLLFILLFFAPQAVQAAEKDEEISFSVNVDRDGKELYEVHASLISKNTYYLFLPSCADTKNLTVRYTGRITETSIGQLDTKEKTIS